MMGLHIGEWVVGAAILAMPVICIIEKDKSKREVIQGIKTKIRMYQETMLFLWVPTVVLFCLLFMQIISPSDLGLHWQSSLANWMGAALVLLAAGYAGWSIHSVRHNAATRAQLRDAYREHSWMMPTSRRELSWFTLGLSVSAGICEELLFRGFFLHAFSNHIGIIASLIAGSVLFGICHLYQGWANVVRTGLVGLVFGIIYIMTDSLLVVIVLHALVDIYGGIIGYLVNVGEDQDKTSESLAVRY